MALGDHVLSPIKVPLKLPPEFRLFIETAFHDGERWRLHASKTHSIAGTVCQSEGRLKMLPAFWREPDCDAPESLTADRAAVELFGYSN
jgi:hypothetical protein